MGLHDVASGPLLIQTDPPELCSAIMFVGTEIGSLVLGFVNHRVLASSKKNFLLVSADDRKFQKVVQSHVAICVSDKM